MNYIQIQVQISGLWRTYNVVQNNSQRIVMDSSGTLVDLLP